MSIEPQALRGVGPERGIDSASATTEAPRKSAWDCPPCRHDCLDLVEQWRDGKKDAGDQLVRSLERLVRGIVANRLRERSREEREDCYQSVWVRVIARLPTWKRLGRGLFCYWVRVVAARRAIDWVQHEDSEFEPINETQLALPDDSVSTDTVECVQKALARMPEHLRQLCMWRRDGVLIREIAGRLNKAERTIHNWLDDARYLLRHCWEGRVRKDSPRASAGVNGTSSGG